ncbi:hypothetical protein OSB04_001163 [Centaurea solstitialis]|uniref:Uncharacterized protein n=1 Tax=Centaurea solstitialis TaxID=347529 RepID=A0AA38U8S0_9ASTR|nr:hypothetical protein OSB04_001163 [Centaurea solstitialis]
MLLVDLGVKLERVLMEFGVKLQLGVLGVKLERGLREFGVKLELGKRILDLGVVKLRDLLGFLEKSGEEERPNERDSMRDGKEKSDEDDKIGGGIVVNLLNDVFKLLSLRIDSGCYFWARNRPNACTRWDEMTKDGPGRGDGLEMMDASGDDGPNCYCWAELLLLGRRQAARPLFLMATIGPFCLSFRGLVFWTQFIFCRYRCSSTLKFQVYFQNAELVLFKKTKSAMLFRETSFVSSFLMNFVFLLFYVPFLEHVGIVVAIIEQPTLERVFGLQNLIKSDEIGEVLMKRTSKPTFLMIVRSSDTVVKNALEPLGPTGACGLGVAKLRKKEEMGTGYIKDNNTKHILRKLLYYQL